MKILYKGKKNTTKWIGECGICGTIAELERQELTNIQSGDYRSNNEGYSWEICPVCSSTDMCFHEEDTASGKRKKERAIKKEIERYS